MTSPPPRRLPRLLFRLLGRLSLYEDMFAITDDFEIEYAERVRRQGLPAGLAWLVWSTLAAAAGYFRLTVEWRIVMLKNYLKLAFRQFRKNRGFSVINVLGLAAGMTTCLLMLTFVVTELSFDDFHAHRNRIFRVLADWGRDGSRMRFAGSMPAIAPAVRQDIPEVEHAARVKPVQPTAFSPRPGREILEKNAIFAEPDIMDILDWRMTSGDPSSVLRDPFSAVLSDSSAQRYFGGEDPMGRTLVVNGKDYQVRGTMADLPIHTHLRPEVLLSYSTIEALGEYPEKPWGSWGDDFNYLLLREKADFETVSSKLTAMMESNAGEWFGDRMKLILQPLSAIHWDNQSRGDLGPKGHRLYVTLFLTAAILVLLIACFNFMNLSTCRYMERMKEVGIRKVVGAERRQLIHQFLVETGVITLASVGVGIVLYGLLQRFLFSYLGLDIVIGTTHYIRLAGILMLLILAVGFVAGGYPALYLSRFRPTAAIRGGASRKPGRPHLRPVLVVTQFVISVVLILGALALHNQIDFMKNSDLGFVKDDVVLIRFPLGDENASGKYPVLRERFRQNPGVTAVTGAYSVPGINSQFQMGIRKPGGDKDDVTTLQALPGDYDFLRSMGAELFSGRDFSEEFPGDPDNSVIINQTAARLLGFEDPIGAQLMVPKGGGLSKLTIIGVVRDFHVQSLHHRINPMLIFFEPRMYHMIAVRTRPGDTGAALSWIEKVWREVLPDSEFNPRTMKEAYAGFYKTEDQTARLINIFTGLALFVSCLGLFGLASFMTSRRVKEIGIRKVLGASTGGITLLLARQFTRWVFLALLLAAPLGYYLLGRWLENFAYRTRLGPAPFLISGVVVFLVAALTVSFQSIQAARSNPVDSLRSE